ncbi:hypothetical protein ACFYNZ_10570 [Streptomyces kebangsaanensis]|uniref:Serine/arginine repetitive matrix protein 2 n=1 Tax=Streptomyces kebangsaanensis TaxID=864058 RepID=A0ABW6KRT8_9ACTN
MGDGGGGFWNEETQRWEDGTASRAPVTPPPPPRPGQAPAPPGGVHDPDPPAGPAVPRPPSGDGAWSPTVRVPAPYGVRPPTAPPSAPSAPSAPTGHSRRTLWTVLAASAAAGVAVALVMTLGPGGTGRDDRQDSVAASGTPSAAAEPSATTYTSQEPGTGTPSPSAAEPPAGHAAYDDPQGFRIAVPDGWQWQRSAVRSQYGMDIVNYRDPTGHHRLQVYEVREASPDESFDEYLSDAVPKPPGFRMLSRTNLDSGDFTGSRIEYLADSLRGEPDIGTWHVVDERFRAADGKLYAIASYGPESDGRDDERETLTTALEWFCPPSTTCPS